MRFVRNSSKKWKVIYFRLIFFILPLDNYDMILGSQWLIELGDIVVNDLRDINFLLALIINYIIFYKDR